MVPTLAGRIQTRIFSLGRGRGSVAADHHPVPPPDGLGQREVPSDIPRAWAWSSCSASAGSSIYHGLQQFRWEKDWPALFGPSLAIPEGILVWVLLRKAIPDSWSSRTAPPTSSPSRRSGWWYGCS